MGCGASAAVGAGAPANAHPECILEPGLPSDWLTVKIVPVGKDMYPEDAPHIDVIELDKIGKKLVHGVGVVTDWHSKRPTSVRIHDVKLTVQGPQRGEIIGGKDFLAHDDMVCGCNWNQKCGPGPDRKPGEPYNSKGLLKTNLFKPMNLSAIWVEIDGLLCSANGFAIIEQIIVY